YGSSFTKAEFRGHLAEITKEFKSVLVFEVDSGQLKLRASPEAKSVLTTAADELQLPDRRLGHLFWALLWYDYLRSKPPQAFWLRKLVHHFLESDATPLQDEATSRSAVRELFNICMYLVDSCLRVCLFNDLPQLLESAFALLDSEELKDSLPEHRSLLRSSWAAYSVLGHDVFLLVVFRLFLKSKEGVHLQGSV